MDYNKNPVEQKESLFDVLKRHPGTGWSEVFAKTDTGNSVKDICNGLMLSSFLIRIIVIFAAQP
jgi:hypothetical protein